MLTLPIENMSEIEALFFVTDISFKDDLIKIQLY